MNISVLGLGIIGSAWAKNLISDGHAVRCWNRTPEEFPNFHASILEAVEGAEVIFIVVVDPPAVQSIMDKIHPKLGRGILVIQSSTISSKWSRIFAEQVQRAGALFLEAPFTGRKLAAEQRLTDYYLGGEPDVAENARPILKPISSAILHIGPLRSASSLKLAMNLNIAGVAQT
jgi:3-hydroxyisobutyrate dehydrogenase-like beta-hydroxyacid dehydrogenase